MGTRAVAVLVGALAVGATGATSAAGAHVAGLVTRADGTALQILTTSRETTTVTLDEHTSYLKWITHKPRQQDNRASARSVTAASCVDVELRERGGRVAKIVRINTDGAGTIDDPCRALR
jgi:hypothetical protein